MTLTLRSWSLSDAETLARHADNPRVACNLRDSFPHPYTLENAKWFIGFCLSADRTLYLAIDVDGEAAGGISLTFEQDVHRKNAELGYWIAEPYWGKGVTTKAVGMIVARGFGDFPIERIYAMPFANNTASRRVLEKNGFVMEGRLRGSIYKNGELIDSYMYALLRDEWEIFTQKKC